MSIDADAPPDQPKTVELPAVPTWAIELTRTVRSGFANVTARMDSHDVLLEKVVNEGVEINTRLSRIEVRVDGVEARVGELEGRLGRTSNRVREVSQADLSHDAQLAHERSAREELAVKVDALDAKQDTQLAILARLDKVASNPLVKDAAKVVVTAFLTWLATKGITLK